MQKKSGNLSYAPRKSWHLWFTRKLFSYEKLFEVYLFMGRKWNKRYKFNSLTRLCVSLGTNALGKGMNSSILPRGTGK